MMCLALLLFAQVTMSVPVTEQDPPPDASRPHSIVVATTARQSDPRAIQCGQPHCTSWFKAELEKAVTLAGPPLPPSFVAELEMGSPFSMPYELVWVVEHRADGTLRINDTVGFHYATKEACFGPEIAALFPGNEGVPRLVRRRKALCVKEGQAAEPSR